MVAEIFMLRLEATARALRETMPSSTSQFVSLASNSQVAFKENRKRPSEAVHEQPTPGDRQAGLARFLNSVQTSINPLGTINFVHRFLVIGMDNKLGGSREENRRISGQRRAGVRLGDARLKLWRQIPPARPRGKMAPLSRSKSSPGTAFAQRASLGETGFRSLPIARGRSTTTWEERSRCKSTPLQKGAICALTVSA